MTVSQKPKVKSKLVRSSKKIKVKPKKVYDCPSLENDFDDNLYDWWSD
jgi:hypothetical protein